MTHITFRSFSVNIFSLSFNLESNGVLMSTDRYLYPVSVKLSWGIELTTLCEI